MSIWDDSQGRKHIGIMVDGKRTHRILPKGTTASEAKLIEAELRKALSRDAKKVYVLGDPPMLGVLQLYLEHAKALKSAETSKYHVERLMPWAEKYTASQAEQFAEHAKRDLRAGYAAATINRSLACVKKGLTLAWRQRLIPENYGLRIEFIPVNNKREVFLSVEQVQKVAEHCSVEAQAAIWAALLTGARRGELFHMQASWIGEDTITVPKEFTKTGQPRVIPIIPALRPWLAHFPLTLKVEGMKSAWRRGREAAGMKHVNFHDLRHSCASIMLGLGVDLYTISKVLGHSTVQTTQRYAHLQIDAQRSALEKIGALMK